MKPGLLPGLLAGALAMTGCSSSRVGQPAGDAVLRDLAGSALVSYERGDAGRAGELYARALDRARLVGVPDEVARNAYNLALCRVAQGRTAEARPLLAEARAWLPPRGAESARLWLAEAEIARREGRPEAARQDAQRALDAGADRAGRVQARLELAALACASNDTTAASRWLEAAKGELGTTDSPRLHARASRLEARLAQAGGDAGAVAAAREREAEWLRQAGSHGEMATALAEAGEAYARAGQPRKAFPCLLKAAASLQAAGNAALARAAATDAAAAARSAGEPDWVAAAEALISGMPKP